MDSTKEFVYMVLRDLQNRFNDYEIRILPFGDSIIYADFQNELISRTMDFSFDTPRTKLEVVKKIIDIINNEIIELSFNKKESIKIVIEDLQVLSNNDFRLVYRLGGLKLQIKETSKMYKNMQVIFLLPNSKGEKIEKEGYVLDIYINKYSMLSTEEFASIIYIDDNGNFDKIEIPVLFIMGIYGYGNEKIS